MHSVDCNPFSFVHFKMNASQRDEFSRLFPHNPTVDAPLNEVIDFLGHHVASEHVLMRPNRKRIWDLLHTLSPEEALHSTPEVQLPNEIMQKYIDPYLSGANARGVSKHWHQNTSIPVCYLTLAHLKHALENLDACTNVVCVDIRDEGLYLLAKVLETKTTIHTLNLIRSAVAIKGEYYVANILKTNTALHALDMSGIPIEIDAAILLVSALKTNTTLHTLIMSQPNFTILRGYKYFGDALKINTALHTLDIRVRGSACVWHIITSLNINTSMHTLTIRGIDLNGVKVLSGNLKENKTIQTLILKGPSVDPDAIQAIVEMLAINTTLRVIDVKDIFPHDLLQVARATNPRLL